MTGDILLPPPPTTDLVHQEAWHWDAAPWDGGKVQAAHRVSTAREEKEVGKGIKYLGRRLKGKEKGKDRRQGQAQQAEQA